MESIQSAVSALSLAFDTSVENCIRHGDLQLDSSKWPEASFSGGDHKAK